METIIYQGQEIQAEMLHDFGGSDMGERRGRPRAGADELWRDAAGNYYARQVRYDEGEGARDLERDHYWESTHRLSLRAAVLWAVSVCGQHDRGLPLRAEAAALLKAPTDTNGTRHFPDDRTVPPASTGPVSPVVEEPQPGVHRFTFEYRAARRQAARRRTVELTDEQMERARELAVTFGLELTAFLRGLVDRNDLPGQRCYSDAKVYSLLQAEHIGFVCTDAAMARRIERAAQSRGESVEEYVAHSLGGDVDVWEECMLLHPTTGDLLDTDYEELYTEVKCDILTAPLGQEDERPWKFSIGKERVNFGVFLRPDQVEKVKYPHMVWSAAEDREVPCVLIPLDPEGNPVLRVGSRHVEPGEAIPRAQAASQAAPGFADLDEHARYLLEEYANSRAVDIRDALNGAVELAFSDGESSDDEAVELARARRLEREAAGKHHATLCALLDDKAAALVRRYLEVTPWEFTAADIINGCVEKTLSVAFINMAEAAERTGLDSAEFHDGAWGYTEEDIVDATLRRTGAAEVPRREGWSKEQAEQVAREENEKYLRLLASRQRTKPAADVVLPTTAEPQEPVKLPVQRSETLTQMIERGMAPVGLENTPAALSSLNASAPEADEPASPAEGDEHLPVEEHVDDPEEGTATPDGEEGK